ncbi:MAG: hypothetical protein KJO31_17820, partial [Gammaproteobacteria bacterium]|nr:hypothetical protein [Gammaproteobacteria bacterium]
LRSYWAKRGIEGWTASPVFGHGVESFRATHGITSHSTPIDLLYNTGVIGLFLFYGMFISIAWRILRTASADDNGLRPLLFAALSCYAFITLSGTMIYQTFLAVFIAFGVSLLRRFESEQSRPEPALQGVLS